MSGHSLFGTTNVPWPVSICWHIVANPIKGGLSNMGKCLEWVKLGVLPGWEDHGQVIVKGLAISFKTLFNIGQKNWGKSKRSLNNLYLLIRNLPNCQTIRMSYTLSRNLMSKCDPCTRSISIIWELVKMQNFEPLLYLNLHFKRIPRWFRCDLNFVKGSSRIAHLFISGDKLGVAGGEGVGGMG